MIRNLTLWAIFALASAGLAQAADYYVAPDGDDANAGTLEKPFKSPVKAAAKLQAGDTLFFRAGNYACRANGTYGLAPSRDGLPDKPITFRNYKDEVVNIDCAGSDWGVTPNGYSYIVFDGLSITNKTHYGMKISAASGRKGDAPDGYAYSKHVTIRNCEVHDTGMECIFSCGTEYLTIENCHLHNSGQSHGLYLQVGCHNAVVRRVTSEDNKGNSGMQLNAAGGGIRNALVEDNLLRNNAQGFSLMGVQESTFRGNIVYNDCFDGPRGSGYRELICWTYGEKGKNGAPDKPGTPCKNILFENNTFVNTREKNINHLVELKAGTSGITFRNNIFQIAAKRPIMTIDPDSKAGLAFVGNVMSTPLDWQIAFDKKQMKLDEFAKAVEANAEKNALADPKLADPAMGDFTPKEGSPAIGGAFELPKAAATTQPGTAPADKRLDIGAVQTRTPRQIGCKLPWKK
jgi:hypothetical protein